MKTKYISLLALIVLSFSYKAQNVVEDTRSVQVVADMHKQTLQITVPNQALITNLLVVVTDKNGELVFLDNKHRYKGDYKKNVNLAAYGKGEFIVQIDDGVQKTTRKIVMD